MTDIVHLLILSLLDNCMIERFRKRKSSMQNNYLTFVFFSFSSAASDTTHNRYGNADIRESEDHQ